eukprot:scaffold58238_cov63-Phaeocystis_antarctica.AAC.3
MHCNAQLDAPGRRSSPLLGGRGPSCGADSLLVFVVAALILTAILRPAHLVRVRVGVGVRVRVRVGVGVGARVRVRVRSCEQRTSALAEGTGRHPLLRGGGRGGSSLRA